MRVKRYVVDSMPDALERIRLDLGNDAIILNTKQVRKGGFFGLFGKQQIEVIAAVDTKANGRTTESQGKMPERPSAMTAATVRKAYRRNESNLQPADEAPMMNVNRREAEATVSVAEATHTPEQADVSAAMGTEQPPRHEIASAGADAARPVDEVAAELRHIRNMFHKLLIQNRAEVPIPEAFASLRERLLGQEVDEAIVSDILKELLNKFDSPHAAKEQEVAAAARQVITTMLNKRAPASVKISPTVKQAYFFGPTGVGKTTTIAKLAAEYMLKDKRRVGFITSDTFRIAAVEQLKTYANILNAPLEVVYSPREIEQAMERLSHCDLILIDTAGRNYRNNEYVMGMKEFLRGNEVSENYVVLSLTAKQDDLKVILEKFHDVPIAKVIFTKSDETRTFGAILNLICQFDLRLSYLTTGQNVPDDIVVATPELVANLILGEDSYA